MTIKVSATQQWWISIKEQSDASVEKFTFLMSKITALRCYVSRQVTEVSTFILHLKLHLAFLSVFIVITYNNVTGFWLWKSAETTLKIQQQDGIFSLLFHNKERKMERKIIITHGAFDIADPSSMQDACHNELSKYDLARHESPSNSVVRAPDRCTGGHGFDSRRELRFFLCPTLVTTEYSIFLISFRA